MKTQLEKKEEVTKKQIELDYAKILVQHEFDAGSWIMITGKFPHKRWPPFMSIHWSHPWPMDQEVVLAQKYREAVVKSYGGFLGQEHNYETARKVAFARQEFRIFDNEFSIVKAESMSMFVIGSPEESPSHVLRPGGLAEKNLIDEILDGEKKMHYDAALLDGCTEPQAFRVAMGLDVIDLIEFPPIGWYECRSEFVKFFLSWPDRLGKLTEENHQRRVQARRCKKVRRK